MLLYSPLTSYEVIMRVCIFHLPFKTRGLKREQSIIKGALVQLQSFN